MMRRLLLVLALLVFIPAAQAQTFPKLTGQVVDAANLLSPQQEQALTAAMERSVVAMLWRVIRGKRQLYGQTVSDIRSFFEAADRAASGRLTLPELAGAFTRLDVDLAPKDMERAFASIDIDGEGDLDYRELRRWMTKRDGTQQEVRFDAITNRIRNLCDGPRGH